MYSARQVAEYLLSHSNAEVGELTSNLKLQKLMYYSQGIHLAAFGLPLFEEEIFAWNYGPVVERLYRDFKIYSSGPIFIPYSPDLELLSKDKKDFLDSIYAYFGQYSALKLMQMTHNETPWRTTAQSAVISKEKMQSFFETQTYLSEIAFPTKAQRLRNAALLLLADYENDRDLTDLQLIETDDFYEYE